MINLNSFEFFSIKLKLPFKGGISCKIEYENVVCFFAEMYKKRTLYNLMKNSYIKSLMNDFL